MCCNVNLRGFLNILSGYISEDSNSRPGNRECRMIASGPYGIQEMWRILKCVVLLLSWISLTAHPRSLLSQQTASKSAQLVTDIQRAQAALKSNNQAEAAEQFRAVLKLDPSNVEAHVDLGIMAFFHNDCPAAEKDFRDALRIAPSLTKAQALLGVCEKRLGEPSAQADMVSAFAKLQDVKVRTQVGIELADFYYQQGNLGQAASVLYTLSTIDPDNVDILFFEQRVYSELASSTLDKLAILAPDSARMQQLIAERLINDGDLKDATIHYRKALEINPKLVGVHLESIRID